MAKPITVSITGNAGPLKKAVGDAESSLSRLSGAFTKVAAVTAVGVGAIATGIGFAVKAAAEDQKSFELLSQALKANTSATTEQIAAIDKQIGAMSIQVGIADDQLRPAFANLARATGDVTLSQNLLTLSTDIAAATGKDLEAVSIALSKAYGGNVAGLQKLGIPLDENLIKTKDFDGAVLALTATFGGAAAVAADTFEGKLGRLKIAFGETVEQVGSFLIPIFTELADLFLTKVVPIVNDVADKIGPYLVKALTGLSNFINDTVVPAFNTYFLPVIKTLVEFVQKNLIPAFFAFVGFIKDTLIPIVLSIAIPIFEGLAKIFTIVAQKIDENRETIVKYFNFLQAFYTLIKERIAPVVGVVLKVAFEILAKAIGPAIDIVFKFIDAFASIGSFLVKVANGVLGTIEAMVNGIIAGVNLAISVLNKLPGVDIGTQDAINISLPTISAPTAPGATSGGFNPINADRIASPAFTGTSPGLALPELPASSGGSSAGKSRSGGGSDIGTPFTGGFIPEITTFGNAERIAAMESARASASSTVNITVNTVTADAELPNLIVESLQRYNLISGPLDISIAA
jgi:hypothetical protein